MPAWADTAVLALVVTMGLVAVPLQAHGTPPVADASTGITVSSAGGEVLAGGTGTVTVAATNLDGVALYNATVVAVLPVGVTYVPGTSAPSGPTGIGEPTVYWWIPDPAVPDPANPDRAQALVWENTSDLPVGSELSVSFGVTADPDLYPVSSTFDVGVGVYASNDEREVPTVTIPDSGPPEVDGADEGGATDATITVIPLTATKAETANPEGEVYRGPDNPATFTITVQTAPDAGTAGVVVTDLVPATFTVTDCDNACAMEVVTVDGEVFTQLTWNLGDLPDAATRVLTYHAFVDVREVNDGVLPGPPTRPSGTGDAVTNTVTVDGTYAGPVAPGGTDVVHTTAETTVTVLDLGIVKNSDGGSFTAGDQKQYSFTIRSSQFIEASGITVTDTIPDGMCPVTPVDVAIDVDAWPAECAAIAGTGTVTGPGTMTSAEFDAESGQFTVTFEVDDLAEDQDVTIGYSVYMRAEYEDGRPTAVGDGFTNTVTISGTTTPTDDNTVDTGDADNENDSSASIGTDVVTLAKDIWANESRQKITGAADCREDGVYTDETGSAAPAFQLGDLVCFRIVAEFPLGVSTRDARLTDFLPPGTSFVAADDSQSNVEVTQAGNGVWDLGTEIDGTRYVQPGGHLEVYALMRVDSAPAVTPKVAGNLAKLRYSLRDGTVVALRDDVDLQLAPKPVVTLDKLVDGASTKEVVEGDSVPFTIAVRNGGTEANPNDDPLDTVEVWDDLPAGFLCSSVTPVSPAPGPEYSCTDVSGHGRITWTLGDTTLGSDGLAAGETVTISYTLTVPDLLSIGSSHTNTAAVARVVVETTDGRPGHESEIGFFPENDLGAYPNPPAAQVIPKAQDTATLTLPGATADKRVYSTGITATGNDALADATIGEQVVWEYSATIPGHTTVFDGVLNDALPTDGRLSVGTPTLVAPSGVSAEVGCAASATAFRLCDDGRLFFPTTWSNDTGDPVTFTVRFPSVVADVPATAHGLSITNTATLYSAPTLDGEPVLQAQDDAQVRVVEPSPSIIKTANPNAGLGAGSVVTYTLTAGNAGERSPLYDPVVRDCLPSGLTVVTGSLGSGVTAAAGTASDCGTGLTVITWAPASVPILGGETRATTYQATVDSPAGAAQSFTNTATITGWSVPSAMSPDRRSYAATQSATVTTTSPTIAKTVSPATIVPGDSATWTVTVTIPADVTLYNASVVDQLPTQFGANGTGAITAVSTPVCGGTWVSSCPTLGSLTNTDATGANSRRAGWTLMTDGTNVVPASSAPRTLTFTITTLLPTTYGTANTPAATVNATNNAYLRWRSTDGAAPTTVAQAMALAGQATGNRAVAIREPNLNIGKSVSNPTPAQGEVFTYTVAASASNAAAYNVTAYNVVLRDVVPEGVVVLGADGNEIIDSASTASGGVWNAGTRTLTWTLPSPLSPAGPATNVTYDATLAPAVTLTENALQNQVTPTWTSRATAGKSYTRAPATASVTPLFPLVDAQKTLVSPNPVYIGQNVNYSFTLTNNGGATAASMNAVDTLPTGWSYVTGSTLIDGVAAADPTGLGQTLTWTGLGALAPTATHTVVYQAVASDSVDVGSAVAHTNTVTAAQVTDATGGRSYDGGNGSYIGTSGTATARIDEADVAVVKEAGTFTAGGTGTFTLIVSNAAGKDPAVGVVVTDELDLPDGVTFVSATGDGWACTDTATADGVDLSCVRTAATETLAGGASWPVITVTVAIGADVADGTEVPNTAVVSTVTEDRNPGNDSDDATGTVTTVADLAVVKTVTAPASGPVTAGETIEWSVTLTNNGPSVSRASTTDPIVLEDTLPPNVSDIEITGVAPDECEIDAGVLTCTITDDLTVGDTLTVTFSGTVDSDVEAGTAAVSNTAAITDYTTTDPDEENNSSTVPTDVVVEESLTIVKEIVDPAPPAEVVPGATLTYQLTIANGGPSDARGVYVVDTLPAAIAFDAITVGGASWTAGDNGDGTVTFTLAGDLAAGATASVLEYTATLDPAFVGDNDDLTNTASVSSIWREDQDDDSATPGEIAPEADLVLTKSVTIDDPVSIAGVDHAIAGQTATYTLSTVNDGPSDADGPVTLTDTLPAGLSVEGALPTGCSASGQEITCLKADGLDVGEAAWVVQIPVRVDADYTGSLLVNAAHVESPTDDPTPLNNDAAAQLPATQRAKLSVAKTPDGDVVQAGENATWTIVVSNAGPSDAQNVVLSDALDPGLVLVETDPDVCTGTVELSCSLGTIAAGGSATITVTTTVRSSIVDGATIPNTATADSPTRDVDTGEPATATDDGSIVVSAVSALTIDKTTTTPVVTAGGIATYEIAVGNTGPSDAAASVVVTDTLPAGLTFVAADTDGGPAQWSCTVAGQIVTCELQDAGGDAVTPAAGTTAPTLVISALVAPSHAADPAVTNTASVTSPTEPGDPPTDTEDIEVVNFADLGIVKENNGTPTAGEEFTWTITVTNHGLSDSVATSGDPIVVTDPLPPGTTFVSATSAGASCTADAGIVTCEITSTMAPADEVEIDLTVLVDADFSGILRNTASVAPVATDEPTDPTHPNDDTAEAVVTEEADLQVVKTVATDAADIVAGQQIVWELAITNNGPSNSDASASTPISVTDTLPAGVSFVSASGTDWTCVEGAPTPAGRDTVTCTRTIDLAVGGAPVISVTGLIAPDVQGSIRNDAVVTPGETREPADSEANNSTSVVAQVGESADLALTKAVTEEIVAGAGGAYTLTVTNLGPSAARDVTVVDTLPTGLTYAGVDGDDWSCTALGAMVSCVYAGVLDPAASVPLVMDVDAAADLQGEVVNTAVVSTSTPDPNPDNDTAEARGTTVEIADLSIVKTIVGAPAVGDTVTYRLEVANAGPSDARGVLVEDDLPVGLEFVSMSSEGWTCGVDVAAGRIACTLPQLAAGASAPPLSIEVRVLPAAYPHVANTATVSATTPEDDDTLGDNSSTVVADVPALSDLVITKELVDELVTGKAATYLVTVTNQGPTDDPGPITVVDTLPAGLTASAWQIDGADGSCVMGGSTFTCTVASLTVGQTATLALTAHVAESARGELVNVASVSSDADPTPSTASAAAVVIVTVMPDTGGYLGLYLPFGVAMLLLGAAALWWSRRRKVDAP